MYRIVTTPSGNRAIKKLPKDVRRAIIRETAILEKNPYAGEKLSGSLAFLHSLHFKFRTIDCRVAYTVDEEDFVVVVHFAGSRENFYEKLRRILRA